MSPEQRLVNEAYAHIISTGVQSRNAEDNCTYAGTGCAFAPAILPEHRADMDLENQSAREVIKGYPEVLYPWAQKLNLSLAMQVQGCHDRFNERFDDGSFIVYFKQQLKELCTQAKLTYPGEAND